MKKSELKHKQGSLRRLAVLSVAALVLGAVGLDLRFTPGKPASKYSNAGADPFAKADC